MAERKGYTLYSINRGLKVHFGFENDPELLEKLAQELNPNEIISFTAVDPESSQSRWILRQSANGQALLDNLLEKAFLAGHHAGVLYNPPDPAWDPPARDKQDKFST